MLTPDETASPTSMTLPGSNGDGQFALVAHMEGTDEKGYISNVAVISAGFDTAEVAHDWLDKMEKMGGIDKIVGGLKKTLVMAEEVGYNPKLRITFAIGKLERLPDTDHVIFDNGFTTPA